MYHVYVENFRLLVSILEVMLTSRFLLPTVLHLSSKCPDYASLRYTFLSQVKSLTALKHMTKVTMVTVSTTKRGPDQVNKDRDSPQDDWVT